MSRARSTFVASLGIAAIALTACRHEEPRSDLQPNRLDVEASRVSSATSSAPSMAVASKGEPGKGAGSEAPIVASGDAGPTMALPVVDLLRAPPDASVLPLVRTERQRAEREGKVLLVLVGAGWCAPCRGLHKRLAAGAVRANARLLEFDVDEHDEGLKAAGYTSAVIPLLARPRADGRPDVMEEVASKREEGADQVVDLIRRLSTR